MNRRIVRLATLTAGLLLLALVAGVVAGAVTRSDVAYFDGFQDLTGVDLTQSNGVQIDSLGGLRMATIGKATAADLDERGGLHRAGAAAGSRLRPVHARRLDDRRAPCACRRPRSRSGARPRSRCSSPSTPSAWTASASAA